MSLSWSRARTIAGREYVTTVRRKAFLFTLLFMPAYFAFVMYVSIKPQIEERLKSLKNFATLAVVDSSGAYAGAEREIRTDFAAEANPFSTATAPVPVQSFHTAVVHFPDQPSAEEALRSGKASQVLVIPPDYLATGAVRRYARSSGLFSSAEERPITRWLSRGLLAGRVDSLRAERAVRPTRGMQLYTLSKSGRFELKDDRREMLEFFLPFMFGLLLSVSIVTGGQYLLQGVAEEKESRILESMLCAVSAEELLFGKLVGLGGAGLTLVAAWVAMGAFAGGPAAALAQVAVPPLLMVLVPVYFLLGYLFYASLMTGIGAITNNMREAQQFAFVFTFANFLPFIMITKILGSPDSGVAVGLSLFPPTAATTMMLRLAGPNADVPAWQIALSIALLAGAAWLAVLASARVFRIGLLMYGKTPNLPEILRWVRRG